MKTPRINLNKISFHINRTSVHFNDVSMSFDDSKYGIVGDNGVGKSTFLKLLSGELIPQLGSVQCNASLVTVPQMHTHISSSSTIAEALGVSSMLEALKLVRGGCEDPKIFESIDDDWDIENRIKKALMTFSLWPIDHSMLFSRLSGGQKTKILLAKTLIFPSDFILLDEPTNNLDMRSREILYKYMISWGSGMIVISHDRALLSKMDHIIEITTKGINLYGGNYDFYQDQKIIEQQALERNYLDAKRSLAHAKNVIQKTREKHERHSSRGRKAFRQGKIDRLSANSKKGRSEKSKSRMAHMENRIVQSKQNDLSKILEKIEIKYDMHAILEATKIPNRKVVLDIENLCFRYSHFQKYLINDFNLKMTGSDRIALSGSNGCGKSTLIKLITNELQADSGTIKVGVHHISLLDQTVSFLDPHLNLIDNFLKYNPECRVLEAYSALAAFKFRKYDTENKALHLSGGEKIRAGLAISLMSKHPPQLIILDEPTNHLDLTTLQIIEHALNAYQGALLAISHDVRFIENIGIKRVIQLDSTYV